MSMLLALSHTDKNVAIMYTFAYLLFSQRIANDDITASLFDDVYKVCFAK